MNTEPIKIVPYREFAALSTGTVNAMLETGYTFNMVDSYHVEIIAPVWSW